MILVGEMRDVETARIAVQSALTGHFVLSSLHATDAVSALYRFLDMGIESFLIASSVIGIVGPAPRPPVLRVLPGAVLRRPPEELVFFRNAGGLRQVRVRRRRGLQLLLAHRLLRPHRGLRAPRR